MTRRTTILIGIASLLLLTWITVVLRHGPIEQDLIARAERALSAHAIDGVGVTAQGRDLALRGEITAEVQPAALAELVGAVWGVRQVEVGGLAQVASLRGGDDRLSARFDVPRIIRLGGEVINPLDAATCQRMLARLTTAGSIRFERGRASPMPVSYPLLNDLAAVAYQCPDARLAIGGHTDNGGDRTSKLRLSRARAKAVKRFFYLAGIPAERMRIVAYGDTQPIASNASPQGRAANRRITFDVSPRS